MFAAATREVVFSNPDVVRRVNAEFIPVALKAAAVDNPPRDAEGDLYRAIRRTRAVPQGICTLNSSASVLAWAYSFQDDDSIVRFLNHVKTRYAAASNQPTFAERFRRFPTTKLPDVPASRLPPIPARHRKGEPCPGAPAVSKGGLTGTIIGRRVDRDGQYVKDTRRQENYMEARVELDSKFQTQMSQLARAAGPGEFALPDHLCRAIVGPAYLGQLDVNPLGVRRGANENRVRKWQFSGRRVRQTPNGKIMVRLNGTSHIEGGNAEQPNGPTWDHVVQLKWQGFVVFHKDRLIKICLVASGSEQLNWGNENLLKTKEPEAEHLMAGHAINVESKVEYGLLVAGEVAPNPRRLNAPRQK